MPDLVGGVIAICPSVRLVDVDKRTPRQQDACVVTCARYVSMEVSVPPIL